jgi:translocator protein
MPTDPRPSSSSLRRQGFGLAAWLALLFAVAALGAAASVSAGSFYRELARPSWAPPGWVFGPVWTVLYVMMAVSAWLVWRERGFRWAAGGAGKALALFIAQLAANALWSWLFFAWRQGAWAFADIVVLWTLLVGTIVAFWRVRPLAGALLLPYLAWVTFASALCWATWRMNPSALM